MSRSRPQTSPPRAGARQSSVSTSDAQGDRCLKGVAEVLLESTRVTDVAARLGGDEFALLMPATSEDDARVVCQRILEKADRSLSRFRAPGLGISIGLVSFPEPPKDLPEVLKQADAAMYDAKRHGKGRLHSVRGSVRLTARAQRVRPVAGSLEQR